MNDVLGGGKTQHQPRRTAQGKITEVADGVAAGQFNGALTRRQVGERNLYLRARQPQTQTGMHTVAENHMACGGGAGAIELERIELGEKVFVAIGRGQIHRQ